MKRDYLSDMRIALVYMIDRATQDDNKSKLVVEALFSNQVQAEDNPEPGEKALFALR